MQTNSNSKSGFFHSRVLLALTLCSVGTLLAMLSVATPRKSVPQAATPKSPGPLKPIVSNAIYHGVSRAARELPAPQKERRVIEEELRRVRPNHAVPLGFVDGVVQTSPGPLTIPGPNATFEGINQADGCGGCIPPDTNGAVGRTQYVQMVNSAFSVFSKSGTQLSGPTAINALFSGLPGACKDNNNGDPVVVYDQLADRWMLSQFAVPGGAIGYHECMAVSQTPDATGPYWVYDFMLNPAVPEKFQDYPHFGLWPDGYYMSTHQFDPNNYIGAGVFAFERDKMLTGQHAQMVYFDLNTANPGFGGHLPSNLDGYTLPPAGAPNYFAQVDSSADTGLGNNLRIWKFHVDWTTPADSTFGLNGQPNSITPVTDFARPNCTQYTAGCVPQLGDPFQLDPIGDRLMYRLAYRNFGTHESLVVNHTVVANSTTGQMGPRWYEVRNPGGTPTIFQQSTFGPSGPTDLLYRWMGSIAMDHSGNMAIGYSTSSSTSFPSIAWAGRLVGDPVNTLGQGEAQMFAGSGPQHGELFAPQFGRWGDYSDMTVDPADDCTFWYTNEYYAQIDAATGNWHSRVGNFKFPQCVPITPPPGTPVLSATSSSLVAENCFPSNGAIDPAEPVSVSLCLRNLGSANGTNVVGTLAATGGVTNPGSPQSYGALPAIGAPVCRTFTFTAANQACGSPITLTLQLKDGATNLGTVTFPFTLGAPVAPLKQNFDGVTAPALPAGWTATNSPTSQPPTWQTSTNGPDTPPNAAFVDDPAVPNDKMLDSPTFMVTTNLAKLTFRNKWSLESGFDGGVLEIKIGAGAFQDWLAAGGTFTANGYNGTISSSAQNNSPIVGRMAWTGSSGGYVTTMANFPPSAAGQNVQLRFRMGSDLQVAGVGWWVDGVLVTEGFTCCSGSLVTVVSRKTHTGAGDFDINLPFSGPRGVECRSGGANGDHKLVFTFATAVTNCGVASAGMVSPGPNANQCMVNLTGVPNAQYIQVNLNGVITGGGSGNVTGPQMGVLLGDTSANGSVNATDVGQTKIQSGAAVTNGNFRTDVAVSGAINSTDVSTVKLSSGTALPSPP
jgi:hypothetical protein